MKKSLNLEPEIICGYKVTTKAKKVWQTELNLLEEFSRVCKKHHIKWFLIGGSLLGAIRHNGFIPWDDDIDIGMFREDYNKLLKIANKEFKKPFFFQTPYTDHIYRGHAHLRMDGTTAILPIDIGKNHHQGIFIDIFPFDEYPDTKHKWNKHFYHIRELQCLFEDYFNDYFNNDKVKKEHTRARVIVRLLGFKRLYRHYEKICSKFNGRSSGNVGNLSFIYGARVQPRDLLKKLTTHKFEYLTVPIPVEYDKLLKNMYGDYMKPVKSPTTHGEVIFDPDNPYQEVLAKLRKGEK